MKRFFAMLLTLLIAAGMLTSCGDSSEQAGSEPEEVTATAADSTDAVSGDHHIVSDTQRANIAEDLEDICAQYDYKGAVYIVYQREEVFDGGFGKADRDAGIENSADTVYRIASVTKQFTAAAILKLCEEGKMTLDDTLSMYYPDYGSGADITVHNLLSMQSGIADYVRAYDDEGNEMQSFAEPSLAGIEEDNTLEENRDALREWIFSRELLFEQGDRYSYSNSNYFLLGEIIEQVSGMSYFDYLRTNFFEPLGMTTAGFIEDYDNQDAVVAKGYHQAGAAEIFQYKGVAFGCGDMMASPKDMYKWTVALHGGKVLGEEMYSKMVTAYVEVSESEMSYGYGLMIGNTGVAPYYFHNGNIPCFFSCVLYIPMFDYYIAVMSNYASDGVMAITRDASKSFFTEIGLVPA